MSKARGIIRAQIRTERKVTENTTTTTTKTTKATAKKAAPVIPSITGLKKAEAITLLIRAGLSFEEAAAHFTANKSGGGSYAAFIARCVEAPFSKEEFKEYSKDWAPSTRKNPRFETARAGFETLRANLSK